MSKHKVKFSFVLEAMDMEARDALRTRAIKTKTIEVIVNAASHDEAIDRIHEAFTDILADKLRCLYPSTTIIKEKF